MKAVLLVGMALLLREEPEQTSPGAGANAAVTALVNYRNGESVSARLLKNMSRARARMSLAATPSYRVTIRTVGGRRFQGLIVRSKQFQKAAEQDLLTTENFQKWPGTFQLSFVDGLDGEVELPWNLVRTLKIVDILNGVKIQEMERARVTLRDQRVRSRREALLEEAEQAVAEAEANGELPPEQDATQDQTEPVAVPAELKEEIDWLAKFPPDEDWNREKKEHLEWRQTVMGVFPDAREQEFLDNFTAWQVAYKAWLAEEESKTNASNAADRDQEAEDKSSESATNKQSSADATRTTRQESSKPVSSKHKSDAKKGRIQ